MLHPQTIAAIATPFILWRVYQRVKRLLVRQKSELWRHRLSFFIMAVLLLVFGVQARGDTAGMAAMAAGMAIGAGLGYAALQRTVFERVGADFYYVPHAPIGIVVSILFLSRMAYRVYEWVTEGPAAASHLSAGPLTLGILGVTIGYYCLYNGGLLRWRANNK